jgi:flagellar protein FliS
MLYTNQYMKYKAQSINTATPGEQIVMLFERACLSLAQADRCIEMKDVPGAHNAIIKAQSIYQFLSDSLDMRVEISASLYTLYQYAIDELVTANLKKDAEIVRRILKMTREFEEVWREADMRTRLARVAAR